MDRYLVLIGGGEIRAKETLEIDRAIASLAQERAGDRRACALFLGTASHDFFPYYNSFHKVYTGELGLKTDVALTVYKPHDPEKLRAKFEKADMIYVGGGDTLFLLEEWKRTGLGDLVLDAYRRGVILCGLSAGAICWFEKIYTDSAKTGDHVYARATAMGLLPGGCCPHYNERRTDFADAIEEGERWLCIENNSAVIFRNEDLIASLNHGGSSFYVEKHAGRVKESRI